MREHFGNTKANDLRETVGKLMYIQSYVDINLLVYAYNLKFLSIIVATDWSFPRLITDN